jgi:hypothetical protein
VALMYRKVSKRVLIRRYVEYHSSILFLTIKVAKPNVANFLRHRYVENAELFVCNTRVTFSIMMLLHLA